jgi:L-ascorbate metabolism protein UlaG (beta-lactamase superfamily)
MSRDDVRLTLIGGPTVLIELGGLRLLTDPTFDDPGDYDLGAVTLTKRAGPALAPEAVGSVDAILLSHDQHADNLDRAGRAFLARAARTLTTTAGAQRLPGAEGLSPWERRAVAGRGGRSLVVTATPARHGPPGIEALAGEVVGFVVSAPDGADAVYVTGDTVWYEGVAEVARRFRPALVLLFAGAARTRGPFDLTLGANGALEVARAFPAATLVAVHNDGWANFTESGADLARAFAALGQRSRLVLLEAGRPVTLAGAGEVRAA